MWIRNSLVKFEFFILLLKSNNFTKLSQTKRTSEIIQVNTPLPHFTDKIASF